MSTDDVDNTKVTNQGGDISFTNKQQTVPRGTKKDAASGLKIQGSYYIFINKLKKTW